MAVKKKTLTNLPPKHQKPKRPNRIRPRNNRRTEVHLICDEEVKIFRTVPSGDVYQFEMKIKGERYDTSKKTKYLRRSLKTKKLLNSAIAVPINLKRTVKDYKRLATSILSIN